MAEGDRIKLFGLEEVTNLSQQINDASTGLLTRVDQLETNPEPTLIEEHDQSRAYPAFYPIKRGSKLYVSKEATTGVFDELKWELIGRANTDDIVVEDGTGAAKLKVVSGLPVLEVTDGSSTKQFNFKLSTGRLGLPNSGAVEDAGDNDTLVKKDVPVTSNRFTWDDTEKRTKRVEDLPATPADLVAGDTLYTEDAPLNRNTVEMVDGRPRLISEPTQDTSSPLDIPTRADSDDRYLTGDRPYFTASVEVVTTSGNKIKVGGTGVVVNSGGVTTDLTARTIEVSKSGIYSIGAITAFDSNNVAANTPFSLQFFVNNDYVFQLRDYTNPDVAYQHVGYNGLFPLNAGDKVSFLVLGADAYGSNGKFTRINLIYERDF